MKNKFLFYFLFLILLAKIYPQTRAENWVLVSSEKDGTVYINVNGLSSFTEAEIYVWSLEEINPPMVMEEVDGDIYKAKSYYLINKELMRYSILEIIFYDGKNNVLKHYNYERNMGNTAFKYSYPIISNSQIDKILAKCLEYITPPNENKK